LILSASLTTFYWRTTGNRVPAVIAKLTNITHRYGIGNIFHIFPTMQTERQELEIQGSYDGKNWKRTGKAISLNINRDPLPEPPVLTCPINPGWTG